MVLESVNLALMSQNPDTQSRRRVLAVEWCKHLEGLKPFMDEEQLAACIPADDAMITWTQSSSRAGLNDSDA